MFFKLARFFNIKLKNQFFRLIQPLMIKLLLAEFHSQPTEKIVYYLLGIIAMNFLRLMTFQFFFLIISTFGIKLRVASSTLIYREILTMKKTLLEKVSLGQIVNLLSNDTERFDNFQLVPFVFLTPIKLIAATWYLDLTYGHPAVAGIAILLILLLFQVYVFKRISYTRKNVAKKTDNRIRLMNDIINGIQAIKLYTWEKIFGDLLHEAREYL